MTEKEVCLMCENYSEDTKCDQKDSCKLMAILKENRKLTHDELVRAIRFMIAAEYEAIQLYTQLAASIDAKLAHQVLRNISN